MCTFISGVPYLTFWQCIAICRNVGNAQDVVVVWLDSKLARWRGQWSNTPGTRLELDCDLRHPVPVHFRRRDTTQWVGIHLSAIMCTDHLNVKDHLSWASVMPPHAHVPENLKRNPNFMIQGVEK